MFLRYYKFKYHLQMIKNLIKEGDDHHAAKRYEDAMKSFEAATALIHCKIKEENLTDGNQWQLANFNLSLLHRIGVLQNLLHNEEEEKKMKEALLLEKEDQAIMNIETLEGLKIEEEECDKGLESRKEASNGHQGKVSHKDVGCQTNLQESKDTDGSQEDCTDTCCAPPKRSQQNQQTQQNLLLQQLEEANVDEMSRARKNIRERVIPEKPSINFDDIIGHDEAKKELLFAVVYPVLNDTLFSEVKKPAGIILYGPPGTGKTTLAKAAATAAGHMTFMDVPVTALASSYKGSSELLVQALFEFAAECAPTILFFDEFEQLFKSRGDEADTTGVCAALLIFSQKYKGIYMIGATNNPWSIDVAFHRRFGSKMIFVDIPSVKEILLLFQRQLKTKSLVKSQELENFARRLKGASFDDVCNIIAWLDAKPKREVVESTYFMRVGEKCYTTTTKDNPKAVKVDFRKFPRDFTFVCQPLLISDFQEAYKINKPADYKELREKYKEFNDKRAVSKKKNTVTLPNFQMPSQSSGQSSQMESLMQVFSMINR